MPPTRRGRGRVLVRGLLVIAAGLLAGAVLAQAVTYVYDTVFAADRARADDDAQDRLDGERPPFTASADPDLSALDADEWTIVLDRTLAPAEQRSLRALDVGSPGYGRQAWRILGPLGARVIGTTPRLDAGTKGITSPRSGPTTRFRLNLFSERTSPLSVTGMRAVDLRCSPSAARFALWHPAQGEAPYPGVLFDLRGPDPTPVITDQGEDQGQRYFDRRRIDLGGNSEPGGLRIAATVGTESCDWAISATYRDSAGTRGEVLIQDEDRPFRAEAPPVAPEQLFVARFAPFALTACHEPGQEKEIFCTVFGRRGA
ncbi:hypothetical protein [Streptomyces sp. NPDC048659]|uniref:hypothetical protein n=1 Tax=Streptomyces sp. NPDC048659 TaxID=3155489 RepID=UPI00342DC318